MKAGNKITTKKSGWKFDKNVTNNFVEHIKQSIPGYEEGHEIVCNLSDFFNIENSTCYELGSSTGELTKKLSNHNKNKKVKFVGIESENPMIKKAKSHCKSNKNVFFKKGDVTSFNFKSTPLIISYYTIQFIKPKHRQKLIDKIYNNLEWGGGFIWFEKVRGNDARFQDILTNLYNNFKLNNGFSHEEILNKTESLKSVLEPFSTQGNIDLLKRAGFKDIMPIYRNLCFEALVCIK
ncbi:methyltransferase domain-containing protein [Alphaproteobacteria bacterium]|nr:methyltransferase domain-containing protein [Alphaproteobacteria bacterium]